MGIRRCYNKDPTHIYLEGLSTSRIPFTAPRGSEYSKDPISSHSQYTNDPIHIS